MVNTDLIVNCRRRHRPVSNYYQALQLLSLARPDIDYFWHMDINTRYTGHHYEFLEAISSWAKDQSRNNAVGRAPFTFVSDVHNTWENFTKVVNRLSYAKKSQQKGTGRALGVEPVGPDPPLFSDWKQKWGKGEEADLIGMGTIFEPAPAESHVFVEHYPGKSSNVPRRATSFPKITRTSKRLLRAMHHGQVTQGMHMPPTMFAASSALHHGLKTVAFPLPIFSDLDVSPADVERKLNANMGEDTFDLPHQMKKLWRSLTFGAPENPEEALYADELYKKWLGYDEEQTEGLCLPAMLLRPVKGV